MDTVDDASRSAKVLVPPSRRTMDKEKGKPHECLVCTQYFMLDVIGNGGDPEGHSDDEHQH